jgi:hypothetical protein
MQQQHQQFLEKQKQQQLQLGKVHPERQMFWGCVQARPRLAGRDGP